MGKVKLKKELKEWGVIAVVLLTLYLTGLHTEVAAFAQRAILATGIITPDTELPTEEREIIDYELDLRDLSGNRINLREFKGKVLFINVWATWCPPCIAEMPGIQDLYDEVDKSSIEFIMLSMDDNEGKVKQFIDRKEYTFPVYTPASRVPEVLRAPSIPTTFVVSKEGQIVAKKVGMARYDSKSFKKFLQKWADKGSAF
ncbi:TlpA family protein disulfide reductase [Fulvivirga sp. RKSG066]|uniref:TlpA family protein disulfide reductase n=1 Tax=Fulvivirga aurantia TaxID=2529383 RepID=UPI0012BCD695|nr:TlpA disulfide reductase family protein [Fulvivirga aurantia]MTI21075.1 TlpA family protein disulfide reductase [Fulvivirga aurantia]